MGNVQKKDTWLNSVPLDLAAGFGVYFLFTRVGSLLLTLLLAVFGARASQNPLAFLLIQTILLVAGVAFGATVTGWFSKDNGARRGLVIAIVVVLFDASTVLIQLLSFFLSTGSLSGYQYPLGGIHVDLDLITWALALFAGWFGGDYGAKVARGEIPAPDKAAGSDNVSSSETTESTNEAGQNAGPAETSEEHSATDNTDGTPGEDN
ncbi:MAG TPA: hypothetical protein VGK02_11010 [Candidatus Aquicultor sp.]|jgi:hypothetical protein